MKLEYWSATLCLEGDPFPCCQITSLSTGDISSDTDRVVKQAIELDPDNNYLIEVCWWVSDSHGDEKMPDGKDVYRLHKVIWHDAYHFRNGRYVSIIFPEEI